MAAGTLREQLTYPMTPAEAGVGDQELVRLLHLVGLGHLLAAGFGDAARFSSVGAPGAAGRQSIVSRFEAGDEAAALAARHIAVASADEVVLRAQRQQSHGTDGGLRRRYGSSVGSAGDHNMRAPLIGPATEAGSASGHDPSDVVPALDCVDSWADVLSVGACGAPAGRVPVCTSQCVGASRV